MTTEDKLEKIKKLADDMYYAAANLGPTVGSGEHLRKTMEEYHKFIIHEYHKEEPITSVWHDKSEKPLYNKKNNALNMIAVAGVTKFSNGQEAMSIGQLLPDGKIYTPISGKEYKFEECPFTKWAYVEDLQRL